MLYPGSDAPPPLSQVRSEMGIPSEGDTRGQKDAVGYASKAEQMARVWELSAAPPESESLGPADEAPRPGVMAVLSPHDDYLYAGRVYRRVLPLVTARTVVVVGVFHRYRRHRIRDRIVFDPYDAWRTPDGPASVSELRDEISAAMPERDVVRDAAAHDGEHSVEAEVYWLRHANPELEIVPILVPAMTFERLEAVAGRLGEALAAAMKKRGWSLGRDVAIVISADA